ncbi:hypothetical protein G6F57_015006 [Rhizopus arrhizus]|uniref:Uncharacterized protein n=1 Tax=Rhizopus oryzae TaxID=64495 RepID=A0A9P6WXN4_RHIOR|nr:hypothetical protein G6F23_012062 [Rhizopus arrhizus]KAG0750701.1 hypothetical protein G6F24_015027 [Rhizopus arrhizus]KAG0766023.1 hypothetical protein G6F22_017916 [Rhizopus arrhizus]KAG0783701.1 hypothetical protein G6F21_010376 [Rhizopus arrhizus]KAG0804518.1 hypothetical protein G6F20_012632 [Rhizopus arrhizus]
MSSIRKQKVRDAQERMMNKICGEDLGEFMASVAAVFERQGCTFDVEEDAVILIDKRNERRRWLPIASRSASTASLPAAPATPLTLPGVETLTTVPAAPVTLPTVEPVPKLTTTPLPSPRPLLPALSSGPVSARPRKVQNVINEDKKK